MHFIKRVVSGIICVSILCSCVSTTTLKSTQPGTKIFADGHYLGEGSVSYSDKKVSGSDTVIELKKEGFADKTVTINRSGQVNVGAIVGGILLAPTLFGLLFFLWSTDYKPYYVFDMEKAN